MATAAPKISIPDPLAGQQTGTESSLSNWAGDYVTNMLGKGQALSETPYQAYTGPLTAGASGLQQQAFQGVAGLTLPTNMGAFTPQSFTAQGTAQQYMNPYIQASLDPQLNEARRQAEISRLGDAARLSKAGAYGGSRQAIMESELNRNLMQKQADITGIGYNTAYDKAAQQFNIEQGRGLEAQTAANQYGLSALGRQADLGAVQRGIEGEGIAADYGQFKEERDFPFKQVQYQQSLLQGMPLAAQSYSYQEPSTLSTVMGSAGGVKALYDSLFGPK
jgi:hypothetical protein